LLENAALIWVIDLIQGYNRSVRPIANKYSDGKVKRTLKRRSKVPEIVKRERNGPMSPLMVGRWHDSHDDMGKTMA